LLLKIDLSATLRADLAQLPLNASVDPHPFRERPTELPPSIHLSTDFISLALARIAEEG
jgi:hypothetical protein